MAYIKDTGMSSRWFQRPNLNKLGFYGANILVLSAIEVIQFVKSKRSKRTGLPIEIRFSSEDSFRSDLVDLLMLYSAVSKVGVNRVGIADTVGWWVTAPSFLYTLHFLAVLSFFSSQVILTANQSLNPAPLHDRSTILWEHFEESLIAVWSYGSIRHLKLICVCRYRDPFVSLTNILFGVPTSSPQLLAYPTPPTQRQTF